MFQVPVFTELREYTSYFADRTNNALYKFCFFNRSNVQCIKAKSSRTACYVKMLYELQWHGLIALNRTSLLARLFTSVSSIRTQHNS